MLTLEDVNELIGLTFQSMPPSLKKLYDEEVLLMENEMLTTGKTIYIIKHDTNTLPILKYFDRRELAALAISEGVILWTYRGMSMLIPAARIANKVSHIEMMDKARMNSKKSLSPKFVFTTEDAIILPIKIAAALLGEDK